MDVFQNVHMGVSKNNGTPKWMVKIRENPIKMDDLGGKNTPIFGNIHMQQVRVTGDMGQWISIFSLVVDGSNFLTETPDSRLDHVFVP